MNQKNCMEYNIGLDIGTNSVGWAVTDLENNILKYKNRGELDCSMKEQLQLKQELFAEHVEEQNAEEKG